MSDVPFILKRANRDIVISTIGLQREICRFFAKNNQANDVAKNYSAQHYMFAL